VVGTYIGAICDGKRLSVGVRKGGVFASVVLKNEVK
jgi:hypothetical protein